MCTRCVVERTKVFQPETGVTSTVRRAEAIPRGRAAKPVAHTACWGSLTYTKRGERWPARHKLLTGHLALHDASLTGTPMWSHNDGEMPKSPHLGHYITFTQVKEIVSVMQNPSSTLG